MKGESSTRKAARSLEVAWSEVGAFSQAMARRSSASSSLSCRWPQASLAAATACATHCAYCPGISAEALLASP